MIGECRVGRQRIGEIWRMEDCILLPNYTPGREFERQRQCTANDKGLKEKLIRQKSEYSGTKAASHQQ